MSQSSTKVTIQLVDKEGKLLKGVYQDSKDKIQIFIKEIGKPYDTFHDHSDEYTKMFSFSDEKFGKKKQLSLTLKLPKKVTFDNQNQHSPQTFRLVDSDRVDSDQETIEFDLEKEQNFPFHFPYEVCKKVVGVISGIVYFDQDLNGNPKKKSPLKGVKVTLRKIFLLPNPNEEQKVIDTITDAQGAYYFDNLKKGNYKLNPELNKDTYELNPELNLATEKLNFDPGLLRSSPLDLKVSIDEGKSKKDCNFLYSLTKGTVRGIVFKDLNGDGRYFGSDETGLQGVNVILVDSRGYQVSDDDTTIESNGEYSIDAPPGTYTLIFGSKIDVGGKEYTLTSAESQTVIIKAADTVLAKPVGYQPELHGVKGKVTYEDGTSIEGVIVVVLDSDNNDEEIDRQATDQNGEYFIDTHRPGNFKVRFPERVFDGRLLTQNEKILEVNSIAEHNAVYPLSADRNGSGFSGGSGSSGGNAKDALLDIASYMPTTQDNFTRSSRGREGGRGAGDLKSVVDSAFNEVLGRNLRNDDPKAFLASLERAFTAEEVKGKTQYKWTPRSYAVQTELGGKISGAQASLYHRAKIAIDDALPLLDGLKPLKSDYDQEEVEAARAIVRTEMLELVSELGLEGGPRIQRVNHIFELINTQFSRFRDVFGLDRADVITVEQEQNFTNFLIIEDYVKGLRDAWGVFTKDFTGTSSGYLGTQLTSVRRN